MKLNDIRPEIETSGDMEEQFFSIQDTGMIFDILRNKMYSNPILAICREISCNARDAHREVKTPEVPCEIQLPTFLEPHYIIKDFGPGISPDRMSNIFIKYTASTKRTDNVQTGGFGLGAKTPFSYSDTFTIETIFDGIKYNYACFIDETKVGKMNLLSKEKVNLPNGTSIKIPIKPADFRTFIEGTEFVTRHWDVKPIIKGGTCHYQVFDPQLQGKDWMISKQATSSNNYNTNYNREIKLIIDAIEYPLDYAQLKTFADTAALDSTNGVTFLYFGVGELGLSANREAVHLDKDTKAKIKIRIDAISTEILSTLQKKVDTYTSLWEANFRVNKELVHTFTNHAILKKLVWQGIPLTIGSIHTDVPVLIFTKGRYYHGSSTDKLSRNSSRYVNFEADTAVYINDLGIKDVTTKQVQPAFDNNSKLKTLQLINVEDTTKVDDCIKKYNLDKLGVLKLSTITQATKKYTVSGVRLLIFKFDVPSRSYKRVSIASMEDDTNKKIISTLEKDPYNSNRKSSFTKLSISNDIIASIMQNNSDYSLYGVDNTIPADKIKENFEEFEIFETFLNETVAKSKGTDYVKIKYATSLRYSLPDRELRHAGDICKLIKDPDSEYLTYLKTLQDLRDIVEKEGGLLHTYESIVGQIPEKDIAAFAVANPQLDYKKIGGTMSKKYPLLSCIEYYSYEKVLDAIANYINMIDKEVKILKKD